MRMIAPTDNVLLLRHMFSYSLMPPSKNNFIRKRLCSDSTPSNVRCVICVKNFASTYILIMTRKVYKRITQNCLSFSYIYQYKIVHLFDLLNAYSITAIHPDFGCRKNSFPNSRY